MLRSIPSVSGKSFPHDPSRRGFQMLYELAGPLRDGENEYENDTPIAAADDPVVAPAVLAVTAA